nr:peptide ABC transporter ATPase [Leptospira mayottensis]
MNTAKGMAIRDFIEKNYTFERPEEGYSSCFPEVDIYEFANDYGKRIYYVGYSTLELSNDHYEYYEFIIHENETGV